jgi:hypothetical protein
LKLFDFLYDSASRRQGSVPNPSFHGETRSPCPCRSMQPEC